MRALAPAVILFASHFAALGVDAVSIRGTVRTADKHRGEVVRVGRNSVQSGVRDQFLDIELRAVAPSAATNVRVSWLVLVEPPRGRPPHVAARGMALTNLSRTAAAEVETETFAMPEREVQHRGKVAEVESKVSAWAVRVEDDRGQLLMERVEPEREAATIHELWQPKRPGR